MLQAPEIINEQNYDEKSDIWSLGCLLYELGKSKSMLHDCLLYSSQRIFTTAALRPPFDSTNAVTLAMKITDGKFSRIPSIYSDSLFDAMR